MPLTRKHLALLLLAAATLHAAPPITEITLPGTRLFTESITSLKDGTLFVGSVGHGTVSRIAPGSTTAVEFLHPGANGIAAVYGIFADEKHKTLWVCSNQRPNGTGDAPALKSFDLKSGAPKGSFPLPGAPTFCNDIAVAPDGTAYVSDTRQGALEMLKPGSTTLELAAQDPLLAGVDGLAFGDKSILYVNSVTTGKLLRVTLGHDGKSTGIVDLKVSHMLDRPDGLRSIGKNLLLMAENTGNLDLVTFSGNDAYIQVIKSDVESSPAVTATKGMAWIAEGKLNYTSDPALKDKDPGTFKLYAVPLPKEHPNAASGGGVGLTSLPRKKQLLL